MPAKILPSPPLFFAHICTCILNISRVRDGWVDCACWLVSYLVSLSAWRQQSRVIFGPTRKQSNTADRISGQWYNGAYRALMYMNVCTYVCMYIHTYVYTCIRTYLRSSNMVCCHTLVVGIILSFCKTVSNNDCHETMAVMIA